MLDEENGITLEAPASAKTEEFFAYGRGKLLGRYSDFSQAADAAYGCMGFVTFGRNTVIWARANKASSYSIRDVSGAVRRMERYRTEFGGESFRDGDTLLLDASGCTLNQVLYFVSQNMPVLLYTGEGSFVYLTGYDQTHVRILDPVTGQSETLTLENAKAYFDQTGNDYICCVLVQ